MSLDFLDLIWTTPFLWRRHCRWPGLSCWGWRVVGSPGGTTTGEGGGVGRLGEKGEETFPWQTSGYRNDMFSLWSVLWLSVERAGLCAPNLCTPLREGMSSVHSAACRLGP